MELRSDGIACASVAYDAALEGQPLTTGNKLLAMRKAIEGYVDAASKPAPTPRCQARQYSDQMQCGRCGLSWDVNDQDRPPCKPIERRVAARRTDDAALEAFESDGLAGQWDKPVSV